MAKENEMAEAENQLEPMETKVESLIRVIRGQQVMLDRDLAELYGVETKRLNEQVKRNIERFPEDFMFQLTKEEFENWKSQFATSNSVVMGARKKTYAFTEQGVAMLSSVLRSKIAIEVNIRIMRAFVSMRHFMASNTAIFQRLETIEYHQLEMQKQQDAANERIDEVFRRSHDRFLCIDDTVYHVGASIKDLGKKWFAFSKMEDFMPDELIGRINS